MKPEVFGAYLLTSRLVERSMAEVFVGVRLGDATARLVVVKRAPIDESPSGAVAEALRREIEVLREGRIEGVAALIDDGEIGGLPFAVIEYVNGRPLDALIAAGPMDRATAMAIGRDLAGALAGLHARGWIHGDVTASNVVVDDAGEVTLVDLGIAKRTREAREMPAGTPGYASPEAALGKPAAASDDIYGWGVVVAECVLGTRLFHESELAEAMTRRATLPAQLADVAILVEPLSLDPSRRPSAQSLVAALPRPLPEARAALADAVASIERRGPEAEARPSRAPVSDKTGLRREHDDPRHNTLHNALPHNPLPQNVSPQRAPLHKTVIDGDAVPARSTSGPALGRALPPRPFPVVLVVIAVVAAMAAGIGGFVVGRRGGGLAKRRDTSLTLPAIPPRAELKLDGRTILTPSSATKLDIDPGPHKLTVQIARREPREYEFVAAAGDHVVLVVVPVARGAGAKDGKADDE